MNNILGSLLMLMFCMCIPLADTFARTLTESFVHPSQILFLEYGFISLALFPFAKSQIRILKHSTSKKWHLLRCVSFFATTFVWISVIKYIPLAQLYSVGFLAPILASLLSLVFLNERLTYIKLFSLIAGLAGTLIILRPWQSDISPYIVIALLSPLCWALLTVSTKKLSLNYTRILMLFLLSLSNTVFSAPLAIKHWVPLSTNMWIIISLISVLGLCGHISLISAYKKAPLTVIAPLEFMALIFASIYGWLFYKEAITTWTIIGASIIFISSLFVTLKSRSTDTKIDLNFKL